ncbi:MAG TPA: copper resistance protein CopD, partial [bacterium]|nr:copper resistance protein CopD [bacterium]
LGIKITLFMLLLVLGGLHDFWLGPKATRMWRDTPDHPLVLGLRKAASWIGRVNLLISLMIVFLAIMIVRGNPW